MVYKVTTTYAPNHDTGLAWDSANINWPIKDPIMSERDRSFGALADFDTPFVFDKGNP